MQRTRLSDLLQAKCLYYNSEVNELRRSKLRGIEIARASRTSVIVAHAIACILLPDLVVAHTV